LRRRFEALAVGGALFTLALLPLGIRSQEALDVADGNGAHPYVPRFYPFEGGERVHYKASWNGIPVASAEILTRPLWLDGEKFYQVRIQAKTWKVLDLIWKMRDSVEAVFDARTFLPVRYNFSQKENKRRAETEASFDRQARKWTVRRRRGEDIKEFEFVSPDTFDPVSAGYLLRSVNFKIGDQLALNLFGGHNRYRVILRVAARETIDMDSGAVDAFRIEARLIKQGRLAAQIAVDGADDRRSADRQGTVWIAADDSRALLRASSQVWVGSVYLELLRSEVQPKS